MRVEKVERHGHVERSGRIVAISFFDLNSRANFHSSQLPYWKLYVVMCCTSQCICLGKRNRSIDGESLLSVFSCGTTNT